MSIGDITTTIANIVVIFIVVAIIVMITSIVILISQSLAAQDPRWQGNEPAGHRG